MIINSIMEVFFSTNALSISLLLVFVVIVGLILFIRYRMGHMDPSKMAQQQKQNSGKALLTGRGKYQEVDVFQWSGSFLRFGLLASLFVILAALNWSEDKPIVMIPDGAMDFDSDIEIEVPRSAEPPPPPPPPPPPIIQEIPDEILEAEDQPDFVDQSIDRETKVYAPEPTITSKAPPPPPPPPPKEEEIFVVAEDMPRFPGCEHLPTKKEKEACASQSMLAFIYENIVYPHIAKENNVSGTVVVSFVVEKDGFVTDIKLIRDIGGGCGDEALRVVKSMNELGQRWTPGKQRGKAVRVQFNLPVKFVLK